MISADHPRFSCTSDMSLTIYGKKFSGPLVHTNDPSGTGVYSIFKVFCLCRLMICMHQEPSDKRIFVQQKSHKNVLTCSIMTKSFNRFEFSNIFIVLIHDFCLIIVNIFVVVLFFIFISSKEYTISFCVSQIFNSIQY